jgi:hypothetical protein
MSITMETELPRRSRERAGLEKRIADRPLYGGVARPGFSNSYSIWPANAFCSIWARWLLIWGQDWLVRC